MTTTTSDFTEITAGEVEVFIHQAADYAGEKYKWFIEQLATDERQHDAEHERLEEVAKPPQNLLAIQDSFLEDIKVKLSKKKSFSYKFPGDKFNTKFSMKLIDGENKVFAYDPQYKGGREVVNNTYMETAFAEPGLKMGSLKALVGVVAKECGIEDPVQFAGCYNQHVRSLYKSNVSQQIISEHFMYMMTALKFAQLSECEIFVSSFPTVQIAAKHKEAAMALMPLLKGAIVKKN